MKESSPSPSRKSKPRSKWFFPAVVAAILFLGALACNLLATYIAEAIKPYIFWILIFFLIAFIVAIVGAILETRRKEEVEEDSQSAPSLISPLPPGLPSSLHQLPSSPQKFVGREEELSDIMNKLDKGGMTISGLRGMGGIGKTALALVLANKIKDRYPDAQIAFDL